MALLIHVHSGIFRGVLRPWPKGQGVLVSSMSDLHTVLTSWTQASLSGALLVSLSFLGLMGVPWTTVSGSLGTGQLGK